MSGRDPDASISGRRVARELTTLIERRGRRGMLVSDRAMGTPLVRETMARGTERTSNAVLKYETPAGFALNLITAIARPNRRK